MPRRRMRWLMSGRVGPRRRSWRRTWCCGPRWRRIWRRSNRPDIEPRTQSNDKAGPGVAPLCVVNASPLDSEQEGAGTRRTSCRAAWVGKTFDVKVLSLEALLCLVTRHLLNPVRWEWGAGTRQHKSSSMLGGMNSPIWWSFRRLVFRQSGPAGRRPPHTETGRFCVVRGSPPRHHARERQRGRPLSNRGRKLWSWG